MIQFSFIPLKKLTTDALNSLETRYELEEEVKLDNVQQLHLFVSCFGGKMNEEGLKDVTDVDAIWRISGKLKPFSESELDSFYEKWLALSKRENNIDEFCQMVSFNSFLLELNKAKFKVVLQNSAQ
ncbi:MAG: hypothetical protein HRU23_13420 [Gammaproteobacteria bacterium]|nr:hypothetical protein [Gammaproteobacteria bacterium]